MNLVSRLVLGLGLVASACPLLAHDRTETLTIDGQARRFVIHLPPVGVERQAAGAVVVASHSRQLAATAGEEGALDLFVPAQRVQQPQWAL